MTMGRYKLRASFAQHRSLVIYRLLRSKCYRCDCYRTMKMVDFLHFGTRTKFRTSRSTFRMANYFAKCFFLWEISLESDWDDSFINFQYKSAFMNINRLTKFPNVSKSLLSRVFSASRLLLETWNFSQFSKELFIREKRVWTMDQRIPSVTQRNEFEILSLNV